MAAPHHHAVLARRIDAVVGQDLHNARRGARQEGVVPQHDPPHIEGVERIHILFRGDAVGDVRLVDLLRQRGLDQDAVDLRVGGEPPEQLQQLLLGGVGREAVLEGPDAQLIAGPGFIADIHLGAHILPHQHHRQPGDDALGPQLLHLPAKALPGALGYQLSVKNHCHAVPPVRRNRCVSARPGG